MNPRELQSARFQRLSRVLTAWRGLLVLAILGTAACVFTVALFAPGFISNDSGHQLEQARTLELGDIHPVMMALIWHWTDLIVPGPAGMLILMSGLYWAGMTGLFWSLRGPLPLRAAGLITVGFFPPFFSNLPAVWKDTLMQGALVSGLACATLRTRRAPLIRHLLAIAFFILAIGTRHNALAAVWPFMILVLLQWSWLANRPRWLRLVLACAASLPLTYGLSLGLKQALAPISKAENAWQRIVSFDLAGMSVQSGRLLLEPDSGVLTSGMGLEEVRSMYHPAYCLSLYYCIPFAGRACVPVFNSLIREDQLASLRRNWSRAIVENPGAYLAHRLALARPQLGFRGAPKITYFLHTAPHHAMARAYPPSARTLRALQWIDDRLSWGVFRPWVYVVISLILLPLTLLRFLRSGPVLPLLWVLSGLAYCLGVLLGAGSAEYRYLTWTILCSVMALVTLALDKFEAW